MRTAEVARKTGETEIEVQLCIDGVGQAHIQTGIGFLDHMLHLMTLHALFNMTLNAEGDLQVDGHHTAEDVGIVIGQALRICLGEKKGICRYATCFVPMDEALVQVSLDISGRPFLHFEEEFRQPKVGAFDVELVEEFMRALTTHAGITLHVRQLYGKNTHHIIEAMFKALGQTLRKAVQVDERIQGVLSTKGSL